MIGGDPLMCWPGARESLLWAAAMQDLLLRAADRLAQGPQLQAAGHQALGPQLQAAVGQLAMRMAGAA